jgi:hypothetical protein
VRTFGRVVTQQQNSDVLNLARKDGDGIIGAKVEGEEFIHVGSRAGGRKKFLCVWIQFWLMDENRNHPEEDLPN